jgi:hypothetical protein
MATTGGTGGELKKVMGFLNSKILRVNRKHPCVICKRGDWCGYSADGELVICMRVDSEQPAQNGGWVHRLKDPLPYVAPVTPARVEPAPDLEALWCGWESNQAHDLDELGVKLWVDTDALRGIGCTWAAPHDAWAIKMKDTTGKMIGIRLRNERGEKWAIKGSRAGLFLPDFYLFTWIDPFFILEGPTDLAAALSIGLYSIGRPSCRGQEQMIVQLIRERQLKRVVIVSDNDGPGLDGARHLQSVLPVPSCLWTPPVKDLREFVLAGGRLGDVTTAIGDLVWTPAAVRACA